MNRKNTLRLLMNIGMLLLCPSLFSQTNLKLKYKKSSLYAGIEVGSKGVKISMVEMQKGNKTGAFNIALDSSVNTDFISFTPETFRNTLNGLSGMYGAAINDYGIMPERIFTVISSGVKVTAERLKKEDWIQQLVDSFRTKINDPQKKVEVINPEDEARLSHLGIIPDAKRFSTFLIDIGSGNTKGGYFAGTTTDHIKLFSLNWGTKSITNAATERAENKSLENYYKQLQRVLNGDADKEVVYAINVSGAYNMSDNIAFSGGAAWAIATLSSPDMTDQQVVPVTYQQVEDFYQKLYNNYKSVTAEMLAKNFNRSADEKEHLRKAAAAVNAVFDQRSLLAGTGLLLKIMRQFEGIYDKKQFYLVKNGQVGWISAYVNESTR